MDLEAIRATAGTYAPGEWLAIGAYIMAGYLAVGLWAAVMSAMLDAMCPRWHMWGWATIKTWLSVVLRTFCLVVAAVSVSYLHTYRGTRGTGRRYPGWGRFRQYFGYPGRHRMTS